MDAKATIAQHGFGIMGGVLIGFAGIAPRSAAPNLIDMLSILIMKYPAESKGWMTQVLFAVCFFSTLPSDSTVQYVITGRFHPVQGRPGGEG